MKRFIMVPCIYTYVMESNTCNDCGVKLPEYMRFKEDPPELCLVCCS